MNTGAEETAADRPSAQVRRPGWGEGFRRLSIVIAALWFAFWGMRVWSAFEDWQAAGFGTGDTPAYNAMIGQLIAMFLFPALAYAAFLVARWVYRGFRQQP